MIKYHVPCIGFEEYWEMFKVLRSGWLTTGNTVIEFERRLKEYIGSEYVVPLASCTAGLDISLSYLGLKPDDEVITTPYTFCATVNSVEKSGAKLVLADVDEDYNISPAEIALKCNKRTKAIVPVHFAGLPVDLMSIYKLAEMVGASVVEDCAHALGSKWYGVNIGQTCQFGSFSFYATKNITTGEGGCLTTNNPHFYEYAKTMSLHGIDRGAWNRYQGGSWKYDMPYAGNKVNMTNMAAALGLAQLGRADWFLKKRTEIATQYNQGLAGLVGTPPKPKGDNIVHAWHLYIIRVPSKIRNRFIERLKELGVSTSVHCIPVHTFKYYKDKYGYKPNDFPVSMKLFKQSISLPIYPKMSIWEAEKVIGAVIKCKKELM